MALYDSLLNDERKRDLRDEEFLKVCDFLGVDPRDFADKEEDKKAEVKQKLITYFKRKGENMAKNLLEIPYEPIGPGYDEIRSILSDQVVIRFSVPCHGWNELAMSKEWKDFQDLLEKYQTGQPQKQHLTAEYQQED